MRMIKPIFVPNKMMVIKGRNTEIDLFSVRNSEKLYILWRILDIGILADKEILYFDRYLMEI